MRRRMKKKNATSSKLSCLCQARAAGSLLTCGVAVSVHPPASNSTQGKDISTEEPAILARATVATFEWEHMLC